MPPLMGFQAKSVYLRESEGQVSVLQNQFPVPLFLFFFFLFPEQLFFKRRFLMISCDTFLYEILILFFSANFHCLFWKEDSLKWHFLHRDENKIISVSSSRVNNSPMF